MRLPLLQPRLLHCGTRNSLRSTYYPWKNSSWKLNRLLHASPQLAKNIKPFLLADIGEGITECEVIKWSVKPFAVVQAFDPLCEVQSDKASVEITSPYDGVIAELLVKEGEIAKVGEPLCLIDVQSANESASQEETQSVPLEAPKSHFEAPSIPSPSPQPQRKQQPDRKKHPLDPANAGSAPSNDAHVLATPSVRHFARQNGVKDLSQLFPGSGKDGRLERRDVETFLSSGTTVVHTPAPSRTSEVRSYAAEANEQQIELGRTRYGMFQAMTAALQIPLFGYSTILDLTALNALLPSLNGHIPSIYQDKPSSYGPAISPDSIYGANAPPKPVSDPVAQYNRMTLLPLLLKTLSRAMQEWPVFRSSLNIPGGKERPTLTVRPHSDIAVAVSTPTGLYTPVLKSVNEKSPYQLMGELRRLQELGRRVPSGFTPTELPKKGATITVSNIGAIGKGEFAAPLLVPGGGVAIVAIGRAKWVERDGEKRFEVGVSWSADHRVVEGAEMAAFVECWRGYVEHPARLIGEGK